MDCETAKATGRHDWEPVLDGFTVVDARCTDCDALASDLEVGV